MIEARLIEAILTEDSENVVSISSDLYINSEHDGTYSVSKYKYGEAPTFRLELDFSKSFFLICICNNLNGALI